METLPVELIRNILSLLPLIDRVKCELVNWKFNHICKDLWLQQTSIDDNELPSIKWITELQTIQPDPSDQARFDFVKWQLTLKCSRIQNIAIDNETINSMYFVERVPYIEHLTLRTFCDDLSILNEAKSLQTIRFERSDCHECEVVKYLPSNIASIEGPSICDPWVDKWDEFFEHSGSVRFRKLTTLTVVVSLQTAHQFNNLIALDQLTNIRFLMGDDHDNNYLVQYLKLCGSKLKRLELFQPNYHRSCRNVYAAVTHNCSQLKQLGIKGNFHGSGDDRHFEKFLFDFKSLTAVSLNIHRALSQEEVDTVCDNNPNLRTLNYTLYMPSISKHKLKNCKQYSDGVKLGVANYNSRHPERRNVIFDTSETAKKIISNCKLILNKATSKYSFQCFLKITFLARQPSLILCVRQVLGCNLSKNRLNLNQNIYSQRFYPFRKIKKHFIGTEFK